jgi:hypothetical protein
MLSGKQAIRKMSIATSMQRAEAGPSYMSNPPTRPARSEGQSEPGGVTSHVLLALGRRILKPFRGIFRFIVASKYMVMVRVWRPPPHTAGGFSARPTRPHMRAPWPSRESNVVRTTTMMTTTTSRRRQWRILGKTFMISRPAL